MFTTNAAPHGFPQTVRAGTDRGSRYGTGVAAAGRRWTGGGERRDGVGTLAWSDWLRGAEPRRFRVAQRHALRSAVVAAGLLVAGISPVSGGVLAVFHPDRALPILALYATNAVVALAVALGTRRFGRRRPAAFAFAFGLYVVVASLLSGAILPESHLLTAVTLAIIPVAVALFIPWGAALHLLWLAGSLALIAAFAVSGLLLELSTRQEQRDFVLGTVIGGTVSVVGRWFTHRLRLAAFEQEQRLHEQRATLRRLNRELEETLRHVHRLEGLLPICAGCKAIRDEEGRWVPVERYVGARSAAEFSHGLCPDCTARLYPEYADGPLEPSG